MILPGPEGILRLLPLAKEGRAGPAGDPIEIPDGATLGRGGENTVVLADPGVSKRHARLFRKDGAWYVEDAGSSNGTKVNGRFTRRSPLAAGDRIDFGPLAFRVEIPAAPPPPAAEPVLTRVIDLPRREFDFRPAGELDPETLKKDYDRLLAAHKMSRAMAVGLPLDRLLERVLDVLFEMIRADTGAVLLGEGLESLEVRCHRGRAGGDGSPPRLSRTVLREAVEGRRAVLAADAATDDRFSGSESILLRDIRSILCVPLIAGDRVHGAIHLDTRGRAGAFGEKDLRILTAAAHQAATAVDNERLIRKMEENARTKEQLKRFLPPAVVAGMMEDRIELDRSPRELTATVLFSDIRGFTSLSENTPPPDLIRLLNDYFDRMVEAVFAHGGVLDKFIGDALMAVWGTLEPEDDGGARRAVNAARALLAGLEEFNRSRPEGLPLRMGIGVNTGPVVAGFMGAWNRRLEFTVVGDTVNVASRLCSRAAAGEIVIGPETWRLLGRPEDAVPSEGVRLKGKAEPLPVYTIRHPGE